MTDKEMRDETMALALAFFFWPITLVCALIEVMHE